MPLTMPFASVALGGDPQRFAAALLKRQFQYPFLQCVLQVIRSDSLRPY